MFLSVVPVPNLPVEKPKEEAPVQAPVQDVKPTQPPPVETPKPTPPETKKSKKSKTAVNDWQVEPMEVTPSSVVEVNTGEAPAKEPSPPIVTIPEPVVKEITPVLEAKPVATPEKEKSPPVATPAKEKSPPVVPVPTPTAVPEVKPLEEVLAAPVEATPVSKPLEERSETCVPESAADKGSKAKKGKGKKNKKE